MNILRIIKKYKLKIINNKKFSITIYGESRAPLDKIIPTPDYFALSGSYIYINHLIFIYFVYFLFKTRDVKGAYLSSLILNKTRKICITYIDNSPHFYVASKMLHHKINMVAIQNGSRDLNVTSLSNNEIFLDYFLCYGSNERKIFSHNYQSSVNRFIPCGSYKIALFKERFENIHLDNQYDICIISECWEGWDTKYNGISDAAGLIAQFAYRYSIQNNLKLVLSLKYSTPELRKKELDFYNRYIPVENININYRKGIYSTYECAIQSKITIGLCSSVLLELLPLTKVLVCDFYGYPISLNIEDENISLSRNMRSYSNFQIRMDSILNEDHGDYFKLRNKEIKNRMTQMDLKSFKELILNLYEK